MNKTLMKKTLSIVALIFAGSTMIGAQHPGMPAGMSHEEHLKQMQKDEELKRRGGLAMGFDQDKTVHHFLLQRDGGAVVVSSKDAGDTEVIRQVRAHFREIAASFGSGLFDKPEAIHGEMPPGAAVMAANKSKISYRYDERSDGAGVVIATKDGKTRDAIHAFLRYQIAEHKTGDPLTPQ